jgi:hypothetical protein
LGCAVGFNIAAVFFLVAGVGLICLVFLLRKARVLTPLLAYGLGGGLAAALFLVSWAPRMAQCWDQFWWFVVYHRHPASDVAGAFFRVLFGGFGVHSGIWFVGIMVVIVPFIVFLALHAVRGWRWYQLDLSHSAVPLVTAALFAVTGTAIFATSSLQGYYLVYLEVWALLVLSIVLARGQLVIGRSIRAGALVILLLMWLPSAFWTIMRFREPLIYPFARENSRISARLASIGGQSMEWFIEPRLFVLAAEAGLRYEPLPWYGTFTNFNIAPSGGLIVGDAYRQKLERQVPDELARRSLVATVESFPASRWFNDRIYVYGPVHQAAGLAGVPPR